MKQSLIVLFMISILGCKSSGNKIPEFDYNTIEGKNITSETLKGGATVMCVWATWCGDCIREIPELNQLVDKYKENELVHFVAFSDEDEATVQKSLNKFPFNFDHIVNSKKYSDQIKTGIVKHFPQVLVIDKDLNIVFEVTENKNKIFSVLDGHITEILNKK